MFLINLSPLWLEKHDQDHDPGGSGWDRVRASGGVMTSIHMLDGASRPSLRQCQIPFRSLSGYGTLIWRPVPDAQPDDF